MRLPIRRHHTRLIALLSLGGLALLVKVVLLPGCQESEEAVVKPSPPNPVLQPRATLQGHSGKAFAVAITPDGKLIASGGEDNTARLWDVATGKQKALLRGHTDLVFSVALTADGKTAASGGFDATVKLWNVATGQERATLAGHEKRIRCIAFSPNGETLASASEDGSIKLWHVATGNQDASFQHSGFAATSVAFSADGKTLVSGSNDSSLKLWDVLSGKEKTSLGTTFGIRSVAFSPDGNTVAAGGGPAAQPGQALLWAAGRQQVRLSGHDMPITCVTFRGSGKSVVTASADQTVRLWCNGSA
jgi:WD40 repeat protein